MRKRLVEAGAAAVVLLGVTAATSACDPITATVTASQSAPAQGGGTGTAAGGAPGANVSSAPAPATSNGASVIASPGGPGGPVVPECQDKQLSVEDKSGGAGAGHIGLVIVFTNTSSTACFMQGYPGAALELGGGKQMNAQRTMTGYLGGDAKDAKPPYVELAAGTSASALLEWSDVTLGGAATMDAASCPGYAPVDLLITPPDTKVSATLDAPQYVCQGLEIHPVIPVIGNILEG